MKEKSLKVESFQRKKSESLDKSQSLESRAAVRLKVESFERKKSESRDESQRVPGDLTTLTLTTFGVWFIVHKFWEVSA